MSLRNNLWIFFLALVWSSSSWAEKVDSLIWRSKLSTVFTENLCESDGYTLSCYEITAQKCLQSATKHFNECSKKMPVPDKIDPLNEGILVAHNLGTCAGRKMAGEFKFQKKSLPDCNSPDKWNRP